MITLKREVNASKGKCVLAHKTQIHKLGFLPRSSDFCL